MKLTKDEIEQIFDGDHKDDFIANINRINNRPAVNSDLNTVLGVLKSVSKLNSLNIGNLVFFETGTVYLCDGKTIVTRFNSLQEFVKSQG